MRSPNRKNSNRNDSKIISGRNKSKQLQTDQESINDYGYISPETSAVRKKESKAGVNNFRIGKGISEIQRDHDRKRTPDSHSYSLQSINSIDDIVREELKRSLEK